jgi:serine/threonine-protein kinase
MPDLIGSIIDHYRILSRIGGGSMATVYYAQEIHTGRAVAVKVLLPSARRNRELVERFRRKARNAAQLRHPYIAPVYESDVDGPLPYLVMAYVDGGSLADRLDGRLGPLPLREASRILIQIADALDYAHARGMLHRDVKPSNILLTQEGEAMLTDFGIARAAWDSRLTASDMRIGTAAYMAPEQARGRPMDRRTDVYALGVVLYEMVTGRTPFRGNTDAMLYQHVHEPPPPLRSLNPRLSQRAEQVVLRALEKRPERRYPSAGALAKAFRRALSHRPQPRRAPVGGGAGTSRGRRRHRSRERCPGGDVDRGRDGDAIRRGNWLGAPAAESRKRSPAADHHPDPGSYTMADRNDAGTDRGARVAARAPVPAGR